MTAIWAGLLLLQAAAGLDDVLRRVQEAGAKGDEAKAMELLLEATKRYPDAPAVYVFWAGLYLRSDRPEPALAAAGKALSLDASYPRARFLKAVALLKLGEFRRALPELNAVLRDSPADAEALNYRGMAYAAGQEHASAEADFRAVLKSSPDDGTALVQLGKLLVETERAGEAAGILQRAVKATPRSAPAHYQLGRALQASGKKEEAAAAFAAARGIQEEDRARAAKELRGGMN